MKYTYQNIKNQLPDFVVENYPQFVLFLEKYYEFLDTVFIHDIQNAHDIDTTTLLDKVRQELAPSLPLLNQVPEDTQKLILQNIIDLYQAKGSIDSINALINILFQEKSEVYLPSSNIFKTSAARWNKEVSVRFTIASGLINSFENISAKIISNSRTYDVDILRIVRVTGTLNVFEAFIDYKFKIILGLSGTVITDSFTGNLVLSIQNKTIIRPGKGFNIGDILTIDIPNTLPTKIKVTKVLNGGIQAFKIIQYGHGYLSSFFYEVQPLTFVPVVQKNLTITQINGATTINTFQFETDDKVNNIQENIVMSKFDYTTTFDYFEDNTYVGDLLNLVTTNTGTSGVNENNALIFFNLGCLFTYPGYYSDNVGFLSDASYLQDGNYYQSFSYVVKSQRLLNEYVDSLKALVHPAGMKVFGEYNINNIIDVLINIQIELNNIESGLQDFIEVTDEITSKVVMKVLDDVVNINEFVSKLLEKPLTETATVTDTVIKTPTKNISDTATVTDLINSKNLTKVINETVSFIEVFTKSFTKNISDNATGSDAGCAFLGPFYVEPGPNLYWDCGYLSNETSFT